MKRIPIYILILLFMGGASIPAAAQSSDDHITYLPYTTNHYVAPVHLRTGITNIDEFLEQCPQNDPAYDQIRNTFTIRVDGTVVGDIPCSEPISAMPISQYTDELIALQVFRTLYYLNPGVTNFLPWTSQDLFGWMSGNVAGINIKSAPGQLYCCDVIAGQRYFSSSRQADDQREFKRDWRGIAMSLTYFVHETRHADGGHYHVSGCLAASGGNALACDWTYDVADLGSYGVQYWLDQAFMTGYLDVGIGCLAPERARQLALQHESNANGNARERYVVNPPPLVTAQPPYGGLCP